VNAPKPNGQIPNKNVPRKTPLFLALPDLKVTSVQPSGSKATVTVTNQCPGKASAVRVEITIYKGADKNSGVDLYISNDLPPLAGNSSEKYDFNLTSSDKVKSFDGRYLRAVVDPTDKVKEAIEGNNWWETQEAPFPDPADACKPKSK
jgi:subtilase family serine protease